MTTTSASSSLCSAYFILYVLSVALFHTYIDRLINRQAYSYTNKACLHLDSDSNFLTHSKQVQNDFFFHLLCIACAQFLFQSVYKLDFKVNEKFNNVADFLAINFEMFISPSSQSSFLFRSGLFIFFRLFFFSSTSSAHFTRIVVFDFHTGTLYRKRN